jgi:hypothetical protein
LSGRHQLAERHVCDRDKSADANGSGLIYATEYACETVHRRTHRTAAILPLPGWHQPPERHVRKTRKSGKSTGSDAAGVYDATKHASRNVHRRPHRTTTTLSLSVWHALSGQPLPAHSDDEAKRALP